MNKRKPGRRIPKAKEKKKKEEKYVPSPTDVKFKKIWCIEKMYGYSQGAYHNVVIDEANYLLKTYPKHFALKNPVEISEKSEVPIPPDEPIEESKDSDTSVTTDKNYSKPSNVNDSDELA